MHIDYRKPRLPSSDCLVIIFCFIKTVTDHRDKSNDFWQKISLAGLFLILGLNCPFAVTLQV